MDALDALSTERPVLSSRLWRSPRPAAPVDATAIEDARTLVAQLPVLVAGGWSPAVSLDRSDAALRLQAAVWELASRRQVLVVGHSTAADVARRLQATGALVPPAAEAVALLDRLLASHDLVDELEVCRVAARLTAYVELRARFG